MKAERRNTRVCIGSLLRLDARVNPSGGVVLASRADVALVSDSAGGTSGLGTDLTQAF